MDVVGGLAPRYIFKLLVVLVQPPPGLDPSAIEGVHDCLAHLLAVIRNLTENRIRGIASRCWWILLGKSSTLTSHGFDFHIFTALSRKSQTVARRADWVPILKILTQSKVRLINWSESIALPTNGLFPRSCEAYRSLCVMFFNPDPAHRLRLVPIEGQSRICSILRMVLTWVIKGAVTAATPIIIKAELSGGGFHGCTVAGESTIVEPSTVLRWRQPVDAVREPGPTTQGATAALPTLHAATPSTSGAVASAYPHGVGLLPTTQGLGISSSDQLPLGLDFSMDLGTFAPTNPSDPFSLPPSSFHAPGAAARLYESDAQSLPFNSLATQGSTSSTFIPPSSGGMFGPYYAATDRGQKRISPLLPVQDE